MAKKIPPFMGKETPAEEAKERRVKAASPQLYRKGEKAEGVHGKGRPFASGGMVRRGYGKARGC